MGNALDPMNPIGMPATFATSLNAGIATERPMMAAAVAASAVFVRGMAVGTNEAIKSARACRQEAAPVDSFERDARA